MTSSLRDSYGEVGMLDMPNARMAPDGELAFSAGGFQAGQRFTLAFQLLPWLSTSFRYSSVPKYGSLAAHLYDRTFGLKVRLFQETEDTPDVSIGIRDLAGTGIYASEYLAATKRVGDFDVTAGFGWGRLAGNGTFPNPFGALSNSMKTRTSAEVASGHFDPGRYFHGSDMGLFGGVTWQSPLDGLDLTLEYSSDRYPLEGMADRIHVRMPVNLGVTYTPAAWVHVTAGWFYGTAFGGTLAFLLDPPQSSPPPSTDVPAPLIRSDREQSRAVALYVGSKSGRGGAALARDDPFIPGYQQSRIASQADEETSPPLPDPLNRRAEIEISGHALLVSMHAAGHGEFFCRRYAAQIKTPAITTVALADSDSSMGHVAICSTDEQQGRGQIVRASLTVDGAQSAPDPEDDRITVLPEGMDAAERADAAIRADAAAQNLRIDGISIRGSDLRIYYSNARYEIEDAALGRLLRVLMADAPPDVEAFHLVPVVDGMPAQEIRILRAPIERVFATDGSLADLPEVLSIKPAPTGHAALDAGQPDSYPRLSWAVAPIFNADLFDTKDPLRAQIAGGLIAGAALLPGLSLEGEYDVNFYESFTKALPGNGALPRVRSDIGRYLSEGRYGFTSLETTYHTRLAPEVFAEVRAGYLESMYAGAGVQVLWRPENERWSIGADLYQVWKRNYDRLFGLGGYHVLIGQVSAYYRSPWDGLEFGVHAGRYLAGDYGATIDISRTLMNGVEFGLYATFTNVSFDKFGEGGFDKGIFLRIPFDTPLPRSTQSAYNLHLGSFTSDGGQQLQNEDSLYDETQRTSFDALRRHQDRIVTP